FCRRWSVGRARPGCDAARVHLGFPPRRLQAQMTPALSVVMPVHNEAPDLPATLAALLTALVQSGLDAELVVVDDRSDDGSAVVAAQAVGGRIPLQVITQPNRGRFEARRAGAEAARGEFVLLLDGRVAIEDSALAFAQERIRNGERVWTSHVH